MSYFSACELQRLRAGIIEGPDERSTTVKRQRVKKIVIQSGCKKRKKADLATMTNNHRF
jgi:hypothetical protein